MLKIKSKVNSKSQRHLLPAFVLYWAAVADFNFAVRTGAFKELYSMDFYFLLGAAISFLFFMAAHNKNTRAFNSTGVNFVRL